MSDLPAPPDADTGTKRELCKRCEGNGVIKIHHGVSVCPRCDGFCYESKVIDVHDASRPSPTFEDAAKVVTPYIGKDYARGYADGRAEAKAERDEAWTRVEQAETDLARLRAGIQALFSFINTRMDQVTENYETYKGSTTELGAYWGGYREGLRFVQPEVGALLPETKA